MDNSSGEGSPPPPPSPGSGPPEQLFTVPVPTYSTPTQSIPLTTPPPDATGPWATGSPSLAPVGSGTAYASPYAVSSLPAQGPSDAESLRTLSLVLLGVVLGFWVLVGIRILSHVVDVGASDRLLIETIDQTSAETVATGIISVLAVGAAAASQSLAKRRLGTPLVWGTSALAVATVATTVWRVI